MTCACCYEQPPQELVSGADLPLCSVCTKSYEESAAKRNLDLKRRVRVEALAQFITGASCRHRSNFLEPKLA